MTPVITFTANDRPWYMIRVLESWRRVRGIDQAHLIFQAEPHQDMVGLIASMAGFAAEGVIRVNERQAGCEANTGLALAAGFETGADFVILGEDDGVVAADVLEYLLWAAEAYSGDKDVLAVCTAMDAPPGPLDAVRRADWFYPPVWGIWRDRWETVAADWPQGPVDGHSWDGWLLSRMRAAGQHVVQPLAARCQQIGEWGTYQRESLQDVRDRQRFTPDIPPQVYREIEGLYSVGHERIR